MKVKNVGENKFEILVEGERYRVCTVSKLVGLTEEYLEVEDEPVEYGLNVEQKLSAGHYYVVLTVQWNDESKKPILSYVDERHLDTLRNLVEEVKEPERVVQYLEEYLNCIEFAEQTLVDIYTDKEESTCVC